MEQALLAEPRARQCGNACWPVTRLTHRMTELEYLALLGEHAAKRRTDRERRITELDGL